MPQEQFDREGMVRWYATQHLKTDPGIVEVYDLWRNAPEREIRFIEVNKLMAARDQDPLEPINFGVDLGSDNKHSLFVLDVTPTQWEKITKNEVPLPQGWNLEQANLFSR